MAFASANLIYDGIIMLILVGSWRNRIHMLFIYLVPTMLNELILKNIFQQPRPSLACVTSFGMPSGHATSAGVVFVTIFTLHTIGRVKSIKFTIFYCLLMILQAYSRIYLHYHTQEQVLAGFTLGVSLGMILITLLPLSPVELKKKSNYIPEDYEAENLMMEQTYEPLMV
mmetsp:Transcript_13517/g.15161  ORF Transcript_13517/g.15161 Transcript_13517/m.15161 type:complete len:170 (+) Transcript_13517:125-634(+)